MAVVVVVSLVCWGHHLPPRWSSLEGTFTWNLLTSVTLSIDSSLNDLWWFVIENLIIVRLNNRSYVSGCGGTCTIGLTCGSSGGTVNWTTGSGSIRGWWSRCVVGFCSWTCNRYIWSYVWLFTGRTTGTRFEWLTRSGCWWWWTGNWCSGTCGTTRWLVITALIWLFIYITTTELWCLTSSGSWATSWSLVDSLIASLIRGLWWWFSCFPTKG